MEPWSSSLSSVISAVWGYVDVKVKLYSENFYIGLLNLLDRISVKSIGENSSYWTRLGLHRLNSKRII
jgi:CRISPR/Cas system-associated protein Csm6